MATDGTLLLKRESDLGLLVIAYSATRFHDGSVDLRLNTTVSFGCCHAMPPGYSCPAAFSMNSQPTVVNHAYLASSSDRLATVSSLPSSRWIDHLRIRAAIDLPGGTRGWGKRLHAHPVATPLPACLPSSTVACGR